MTLKKENYFPSQWKFLTNKKHKVSAYIGGMGSGKTWSLLHKVFYCLLTKKNKDGKSNGLILYPTYFQRYTIEMNIAYQAWANCLWQH